MWTRLLVPLLSCQCLWLPVLQLPVSLASSVSGCQYLSCQCLRLPGTSVASASASVAGTSVCLGCLYLNCWCLCLGCCVCWCLGWCPGSVPWLPEDITKPVAEDSCEMIVKDTNESSAQISCRPSQFQTLITSNNRSGDM